MRKFLRLKESVIDEVDEAQFIRNRLYEVAFEFQNYYIIVNHCNARYEISKALEEIKYEVVIRE